MPNTYETKLWGGRFRGDEDALMQHFNSECWRTSWLVEPDIQGSLAHVAMQVKCGLLHAHGKQQLSQARLRRESPAQQVAGAQVLPDGHGVQHHAVQVKHSGPDHAWSISRVAAFRSSDARRISAAP